MFPITYDLRRYSKGDPTILVAQILKEPRQRLTEVDWIKLAVPPEVRSG